MEHGEVDIDITHVKTLKSMKQKGSLTFQDGIAHIHIVLFTILDCL